MPGENLHKLNKRELKLLRAIVRRIYFQDFTEEEKKILATNRECDRLIDSLLPETVEGLREAGERSDFASRKKFFLPSKIVGMNGKPILREDA